MTNKTNTLNYSFYGLISKCIRKSNGYAKSRFGIAIAFALYQLVL